MRENLLNRKDNDYIAAQKYALKYFEDLQTHFSLSDIQIINIIKTSLDKFKKHSKEKKWWHFL